METPPLRSNPPVHKAFIAGTAIVALLGVVYLVNPWAVAMLNNKIMDAIIAGNRLDDIGQGVVIVTIDDQTLERYGQWPWPRYQLARLLEEIARLGARSIALDFVMPEPDRTSLKSLLRALEGESGYEAAIEVLPPSLLDNDAVLAETLANGPFVLGYEFLFKTPADPPPDCHLDPLRVVEINKQATTALRGGFYQAQNVLCNIAVFADAASRSGFLNGRSDRDGILRRLPLVIAYGERLYPSLALAAFMQAEGISESTLRLTRLGEQNLVLGGKSVPMDGRGNFRAAFRAGPDALPHVSALSVLAGREAAEQFEDKIIFVGLSAAGLNSEFATAVGSLLSEVEIHAQLTEMLLSGVFIHRTVGMVALEVLIAFLIALPFSLGISRMALAPLSLIAVLCLAALWQGANFFYSSKGLLFSPLLPASGIVVCGVLLSLYIYWARQHAAGRSVQDAVVLMKGSEKYLNSIIQTIPDIVFRLDTSGRITFISPAIVKYAEKPEALIGKHILDIVAPADREMAHYKINERRTGSRATSDVEIRLLLSPPEDEPRGGDRYFSISAHGIYAKDRPDAHSFQGTQGIARDISRRKLLERQLEHSKKMEAIGGLAAGVAHDLNNILSGLVSYPELLLLDLAEDSPMRKHIETIQRSGQRAAAIVQDMLTIARQGVHNSEILNLNDTVKSYLSSPEHQNLVKSHPHLSIAAHFEEDLMNVKGSRVHVTKILMNLMNNAAEAMPSGGTISLATHNRYLDAAWNAYERIPEGEYVVFSIADEGVGIADKDVSRIFEPFYTKKQMGQSGSGLGMTVVWSSVKEHQGYIDIKTREGEGTCFEVYLPATRDVLADKAKVTLQDYLGSESILVVDDVEEQREIAVRMLGKLGYRVNALASGEKAVEYLQTRDVDLLVLDMVMHPGIDGLETYQRICRKRPGQKAIIASGFSESDRVKALQAMGAGTYIRKPYTLEKIGVAVRRELDRPRRT